MSFSCIRICISGSPQSSLSGEARLIEILIALERIGELLDDPACLSAEVRAAGTLARHQAVGCCEAPRGTLFHDYTVAR